MIVQTLFKVFCDYVVDRFLCSVAADHLRHRNCFYYFEQLSRAACSLKRQRNASFSLCDKSVRRQVLCASVQHLHADCSGFWSCSIYSRPPVACELSGNDPFIPFVIPLRAFSFLVEVLSSEHTALIFERCVLYQYSADMHMSGARFFF